MRIDLEEIESFNLVLAGTDLRESPVPDNFVAAEDDLVCADVRPWPIVEDFGDELGLRCDVQVIELFYMSVFV